MNNKMSKPKLKPIKLHPHHESLEEMFEDNGEDYGTVRNKPLDDKWAKRRYYEEFQEYMIGFYDEMEEM